MPSYQTGYQLQMVGGVPVLDTTQPPVSVNPWGPIGAPASFETTTARRIIDSARLRHHTFTAIELGDGAAVLFLDQRQRDLLAKAGAMVEGLVGTTMQYPITPNVLRTGVLISFNNGVPFYTPAGGEGVPLHVNQDGVPYFDPSEAAIAADPIGVIGGPMGFPLPQDLLRLINVMLIYATGPSAGALQYIPCILTDERQRNKMLPGRDPVAFIANNRIVPMLAVAGPFPGIGTQQNAADRWFNVSGIQISYVPFTRITSLDDQMTIPAVLNSALIAATAKLFALQSKRISGPDKLTFVTEAAAAEAETAGVALDTLGSAELEYVQYNGD